MILFTLENLEMSPKLPILYFCETGHLLIWLGDALLLGDANSFGGADKLVPGFCSLHQPMQCLFSGNIGCERYLFLANRNGIRRPICRSRLSHIQ